MRIRRVAAAAVIAVAALAVAMLRHHGDPPPAFAAERVRRGDLVVTLREMGTLAPRDPLVVKARFSSHLQFMVEDGAWVEPGDTVYVLGEDDEIQKVNDDRSQLLSTRQELQLARMKRAHAGEVEDAKLAAAERAAALEEVRWRILTAEPVGGMELARLDDQLRPLEAETASVRAAYEKAQDAYQAAVDGYLEALDRAQDQRESEDRLQARVDELSAAAGLDPEGLNAAQRADRDQAAKDLVGVQDELAKLKPAGAGLDGKLSEARAARDAAKGPRDAAQAALAAREAREEELFIRIEIEKRGLPLVQLRLDRESGALQLDEARRKRAQGEAAAGSLSAAELDDLRAAEASAADQLHIIDEKIAIAARPPAPELVEEGRSKLERARAKAGAAQADHDRALAIADQEVELQAAKERRLSASIEGRSKWFPAMIEANIEFSERELAALERDGDAAPGDAERRAELAKDVERMHVQLDAAKADPPASAKAEVAGIVKVRGNGNRPLQAGDQVWEYDVVAEIHPPGKMQVLVKVNEVNVARLRVGLPVSIEIPSLPGARFAGQVEQLAGVGKDKYDDVGGHADVTEFDAHVTLDGAGSELRQGMSALVAVDLERLKDVLWLPLAAVRHDGDGWAVMVGDQRAPTARRIQGHPFADDRFVVEGGIGAEEMVWVPVLAEQK